MRETTLTSHLPQSPMCQKLLQNKQANKCNDNNNSKTSALAELHELLYWFVIHRYGLGILNRFNFIMSDYNSTKQHKTITPRNSHHRDVTHMSWTRTTIGMTKWTHRKAQRPQTYKKNFRQLKKAGLFGFAFLWWLRISSISLSVFQPFEIHLLRVLCLDLYPIFLLDYLFFDVKFLHFFVHSGNQSSVWCGVREDLFPFCRLLFCLVGHVLCFIEASQCQESHLLDDVLSVCGIWVIFRKCFFGTIYFPLSLLWGSVWLVLRSGLW